MSNECHEIDFLLVNVCADEFEDHTFQHSCGLTFTRLKMMVNKYSERENDGEAMMPHWRINMIDFHNSHNKYLILGHKDYFLVRINIKCETLMSRSAHIC